MLSEQGNSDSFVGNTNAFRLEKKSNPIGRKSCYTKTQSATVAFPFIFHLCTLLLQLRLHTDVSTLECKLDYS